MRIFKKYRFLLFVVLTILINNVMSFLLEPANGSSDTMWREYYQEEEIDTIFIGSSLCSASFEPQVFDEQLGVKSFNMGTPMQALDQNITAVGTAFEDHEIKTVIIGMGFFVLQEEIFEEAELTFEKELARNKGGLEGFLSSIKYIYSEGAVNAEKSLNYWFPWLYNKEAYSWDIIKRNVTSKINIMMDNQEDATAVSLKGYRPYEGYIDYSDIGVENSFCVYEQTLKSDNLQKFEKLLQMCKEEKVDVLVINTPHPTFDVISCRESYADNTNIVKALCETYDVDYYDFSLLKEDIFYISPEMFYNFEHLNYEGSVYFSRILSEFMRDRTAGKTVDSYFYSVEEFMQKNTKL